MGEHRADMWKKRKAGINPLSQLEFVNISSDMVEVNSQVVPDHFMKEYSGSRERVQLHTLLTSALDGDE